jgi:hypothetical protein
MGETTWDEWPAAVSISPPVTSDPIGIASIDPARWDCFPASLAAMVDVRRQPNWGELGLSQWRVPETTAVGSIPRSSAVLAIGALVIRNANVLRGSDDVERLGSDDTITNSHSRIVPEISREQLAGSQRFEIRVESMLAACWRAVASMP